MAKKDTTKTILIIGGVALGAYILTRPSTKEKIQEVIAGGGFPGVNLDLQIPAPDLTGLLSALTETVGGTCFPSGLLPDLNLPGSDLLGGLDEIFSGITKGGNAALPEGHATWADVAYSLPTWAKGALGVGATALGGYGGYHLVRAFAPTLRAIGTQSARAIGGAGTVLKNLVTRGAAVKLSGNVIKSVPVASTGIRAGILGGILPALAVTGIIEGGYQIVRMIRGEQNVGMTGVPPLDIINLITGKFKPWSAAGVPTLLLPQFGTAAAGQPPAAQTEINWWQLGGPGFIPPEAAEVTVTKSPQEIYPGYGGSHSIQRTSTQYPKVASPKETAPPGYGGHKDLM